LGVGIQLFINDGFVKDMNIWTLRFLIGPGDSREHAPCIHRENPYSTPKTQNLGLSVSLNLERLDYKPRQP